MMPGPEPIAQMAVLALFVAPLLVAAAFDLWTFRIPNLLNGAFLALFPLAALLAPAPLDWQAHLAGFGLVLLGGIVLFSFRLLGGGDVKLLAVAGLWLGLPALPVFLLWVGLLGGGLSLLLLMVRADWLTVMVHGTLGRLPRVLEKGAAVPYGVAIAAGGLMSTSALPLLAGG